MKCLIIYSENDEIKAAIRSPASDDEVALMSAQPHIWGLDSNVEIIATIGQTDVRDYSDVDFESDRHRVFIGEQELEDVQLYLPRQGESLADTTDFDAVVEPPAESEISG